MLLTTIILTNRNEGMLFINISGYLIQCTAPKENILNIILLPVILLSGLFVITSFDAQYKSCVDTYIQHEYITQTDIETKTFFYVAIDNVDTIWSPLSTQIIDIAKNIGNRIQDGESVHYSFVRGCIKWYNLWASRWYEWPKIYPTDFFSISKLPQSV